LLAEKAVRTERGTTAGARARHRKSAAAARTEYGIRFGPRAGRQIVVWTVDTQASMKLMLDARVDGIITGRPDLARTLLEGR